MKINVFELDENEEQLVLIYESIDKNENLVNLLSYKNHYVLIKDINHFEFSNCNKHRLFRCLQCNDKRYDSLEKLEKHCKRCILGLDDIEEILPTEGKDDILKFKNINCTFKHPFFVTADFESTFEKVDDNNEDKRSQIYQHHIANSYGLKYICDVSKHSEPIKIFNSSDPEKSDSRLKHM